MPTDNPVVTVLITAYNRAATLSRAIESVIAQTYQNWELIVVDDASTDKTPELLAELAARDVRIHIIRNSENQYRKIGLPGNLNQGLATARGEYIARLDDDDYWIDPEKLQKQVEFLDSHPEIVVVGGGMRVVDGEGKERFHYLKKETDFAIRPKALFANPFSHTTVMFRTKLAKKVGGYREKFAEDWDLWLTMGNYGKFYNFQEYFTGYTQTEENYSFIHQRAQSKVILGFIKKHKNEYPNFQKAYFFNLVQYWYSFLPVFLRRKLHSLLLSLKQRAV